MGLLRSAAAFLGNVQHLGPRIAPVERMRMLTAADVMRHFANVSNVATPGDLTREHVEKMGVAATSLNGVLSPLAVAPHFTKAVARLVRLCCDGSGHPEFISAAVTT